MSNRFLRGIKSTLSNHEWWKGVFGNILATIVGILLTIGIGVLVQWREDKKMSREMMFHVLMETEHDLKEVERCDSLYLLEINASKYFMDLYNKYDHDLTKAADKEPKDTLNKYFYDLFKPITAKTTRGCIEKYFYNTQMMYQFEDPNTYYKFATFVQFDIESYERMDKYYEQIMSFYNSFIRRQQEGKRALQIMNEMIADNELSDLTVTLGLSKNFHVAYTSRVMVRYLLKLMDATPEEYEEYKQEHNTDAIDEEVGKEIFEEDSIKQAKEAEMKAKAEAAKTKPKAKTTKTSSKVKVTKTSSKVKVTKTSSKAKTTK